MTQLFFLVLAIVGLVYSVNGIYDDTFDPAAQRYGRIGLFSLAVGVVGLVAMALRSC